jgi:glycosyltransferase involved in cell wall biosynthesis
MCIVSADCKYVWVTWERQRRSVELAKAFDAELFVIERKGIFRYVRCLCGTFSVVKKTKPSVLFVQNPSMILAVFSVLFIKPFFSIPIVVDRHSNFLLTPKKRSWLKEYVFNFLSYTTIRYADLTILTNSGLAHVVRVLGGKPVVLPDKIPYLAPAKKEILSEGKRLLAVSSFAEDEPIEEILQAFGKEEMSSFTVFMSGNSAKLSNSLHEIPSNIVLTGYLSDGDFVDLLFQVDAVIVLTKMEYTLLCGCYEAISAGKPLLTSNSAVLRQLFTEAVFVENTPDSIASGVWTIFADLSKHKSNSLAMKKELIQKWNEQFEYVKIIVKEMKNTINSNDNV